VIEIGTSGIKVPPVCVGTWQWGSRSWGYGSKYFKEDLRAAFKKAIDMGLNFFDTAEVYAGGLSEKLLGEFSRDYEEGEVIIATKVWPTHAWGKGVVKSAMRSLERLSK
jgi:aryl-alcohol dehydrogenase-like predicted oxidoreductase